MSISKNEIMLLALIKYVIFCDEGADKIVTLYIII